MSYLANLCFSILEEHFGPVVASVSRELSWGPKPLKFIVNSTQLPVDKVKSVLCVLIQYDFVGYKCSKSFSYYEYTLLHENVLLLLSYPKYAFLMKRKYGLEAKLLTEELILCGSLPIPSLLSQIEYNYFQDFSSGRLATERFKDTVKKLILAEFIVEGPKHTDEIPLSSSPESDPNLLSSLTLEEKIDDRKNYWKLNRDRFFQEFRNDIIIKAIERRFDHNAGTIIRHLFKLSYSKSEPWQSVSHPVPVPYLKESVANDVDGLNALKFIDQYVSVMEDDSNHILRHSTEYTGGIVVNMKNFINSLTVTTLSAIVKQKFGPKASRIFRLVYDKKYCELEQIQQLAMVPDKEAKQIAYSLLQQNFLQIQDLKSSTTFVGVPNKAFFLFHIDLNTVKKIVNDMCYKALYNCMERRSNEQRKYCHVYEKKIHTDTLMACFEQRGATPQQILELVNDYISPPEMSLLRSVEKFMMKFQIGEMQIYETIILLQLYTCYNIKITK